MHTYVHIHPITNIQKTHRVMHIHMYTHTRTHARAHAHAHTHAHTHTHTHKAKSVGSYLVKLGMCTIQALWVIAGKPWD